MNGKPKGFFEPVDFVALKAEESDRMAQHAHGLICSRFFKLYNIDELMEKGSEMVMSWMGCVATSVMGPRLVSLSEDSSSPLNRMPKVWKEGIVGLDGILELPKRNRSPICYMKELVMQHYVFDAVLCVRGMCHEVCPNLQQTYH